MVNFGGRLKREKWKPWSQNYIDYENLKKVRPAKMPVATSVLLLFPIWIVLDLISESPRWCNRVQILAQAVVRREKKLPSELPTLARVFSGSAVGFAGPNDDDEFIKVRPRS